MMDVVQQDASGYGEVVALYEADKPIHVGRVGAEMKMLDPRQIGNFLDQKYCQLVARSISHCYRVWDTNEPRDWRPPKQSAFMLGSSSSPGIWLSMMRPSFMTEYRQSAAILDEWNRADYVLDASISAGARIYVGRTGSQSSGFGSKRLIFRGGAMQIFLPRDQFGYLRLNKWWVVR